MKGRLLQVSGSAKVLHTSISMSCTGCPSAAAIVRTGFQLKAVDSRHGCSCPTDICKQVRPVLTLPWHQPVRGSGPSMMAVGFDAVLWPNIDEVAMGQWQLAFAGQGVTSKPSSHTALAASAWRAAFAAKAAAANLYMKRCVWLYTFISSRRRAAAAQRCNRCTLMSQLQAPAGQASWPACLTSQVHHCCRC